MNWVWIDRDAVLSIHEEQLLEHGGGNGIRDVSLLDSALARPEQLANYANPDAFDLAAAYAFGIARNHPFVDGNKRTAWVVARVFLLLHGWDRNATDEQCYITMIQFASGEIDQNTFASWLRANSKAHEI
jgi:death on curing protein